MYLGKESHAYNKGKTLAVSKVPLPDYRADLDERHGSTQKEVEYIYPISMSDSHFWVEESRNVLTMLSFLQIRMSTDIERRVGNLLNNSQPKGAAPASVPFVSTDLGQKQSITATKSVSSQQNDSSKDKLNAVLKERQELLQVHNLTIKHYLIALCCILNLRQDWILFICRQVIV